MFKILVCNVTNFESLPVITVVMPDGKNYSWEKEYYLEKCQLVSI